MHCGTKQSICKKPIHPTMSLQPSPSRHSPKDAHKQKRRSHHAIISPAVSISHGSALICSQETKGDRKASTWNRNWSRLLPRSGNRGNRCKRYGQNLFTKMLSRVSQVSRVGFSLARASSTARVWVDKNTKVIGQGITGKNVGARGSVHELCRAPSTPSRPSSTEPRWSEV